MQVDKSLISKLENLAKLELSDQEKETLIVDMNDILGMIAQLNSLDTEEVEPLIHMAEGQQLLRKDEVKNQLSTIEALKNAPSSNDHFFKVPKVIDL